MISLIGFSDASQVSLAVDDSEESQAGGMSKFICRRCRLTETSTFNENVLVEEEDVEQHLAEHKAAGHSGADAALSRFKRYAGIADANIGAVTK